MDCSIRISAVQRSLTTTRSFSQLTTSFFGSQCQGIRPALFLALPFAFLSSRNNSCSFTRLRLYFLKSCRFTLDCISFSILFSRCFFLCPSFLRTEINRYLFSIYLFLHSIPSLVGTSGLEPPTSRLSGVRSNHLSYAPVLVEMRRIELLTPCLQSRCSPS